MSLTLIPIRSAIVAAFGTAASMAAHAAFVSIGPSSFAPGAVTVTDTCGTVAAANCKNGASSLPALPVTLATPTLNQFDPATGVLLGVTISLESTRTHVISGSMTNAAAGTKTVGDATSKAQFSAPGISSSNLGTLNLQDNVKIGATTKGSFGPTSKAVQTDAKLSTTDAAVLDSYVGAGSVGVNLVIPSMSVESSFSNGVANQTKSSATYSVEWSGSVSGEYEYKLHAAPSFDGSSQVLTLDLDFGSFFVGDAAGPLEFALFNLAGDRVGLDLDGFDAFSGPFGSNLAAFLALAAGSSQGPFAVAFDTSTAGDFAASYQLFFSDEDIGAASTRSNYELTLNLTGEVRARPTNGVPEPSILALIGASAAGLSLFGRRRRSG
jgi:hypothetical protein